MQLGSIRPAALFLPDASSVAKAPPEINVGADVPNYTGPKDGLSHPKFIWLMRPVNRMVIAGRYRLDVEGRENLPTSGPNMYCPTHPSMFDPPLIPAVVNPKDMRFMANKFVFDNIRGTLMTWGGAFPVDREKPSVRTCRHSLDVLRKGSDLCVFPEGSLPDEHKEGRIGAIKKGPAAFALKAGVEYIVPMAIHYAPDVEKRPGELAVGLLAAAAVTTAGVVAGIAGGPAARLLAGTITAGLTAAFIGGRIAHRVTAEPEWNNQWPKYIEMLRWGAASGAAGLLAGAFALPDIAIPLTSVAAGVSTFLTARSWAKRDVAHVKIAPPISLEKYRGFEELEGREKGKHRKEAVRALTIDLHRAMGNAKSELTGVPYDDKAEKFRGTIIETLRVPTPGSHS